MPLQKEFPLLGKEEAEPGEVHLLQVLFDLREVGVDRGVDNQAAREPVLEVEADVPGQVVRERNRGALVREDRSGDVGLQLEVLRLERRLHADERRGDVQTVHAARTVRSRDAGQERQLVLPLDDPANVDPPDLRAGPA